MPVTTAFPSSRVGRGVAIQTLHSDLGTSTGQYRPARIAVFAQVNNGVTYSPTKRQVFSAYEAGTLYGFGSPIHLMIRSLLPAVAGIPVTVYPLAEPAGSVATGDVTPSGSVTGSAEQYRFVCSNIKSDRFTVSDGDTVADICTNMTAAINSVSEMPVVAVDDTTKVTINFKSNGTIGNNAYLEVESPDGASIGFNFTQPVGGTGVADITTAIDQVGNVWESHVVNQQDYTDSDELDEYSAFGETRMSAQVHKPVVVITGTNEASFSTLTAVTDARKSDRTNVIFPNPASNDLPFVIAAEAAREISITDNAVPAHDYCLKKLVGLTPALDSAQWIDDTNDAAVKLGCSTIEVRDGVVRISDTVTCYHPTGEEPPGFRYVCDFAKRSTIVYLLSLAFDNEEWAGAPLVPDSQVTDEPTAKKPKHAVAIMHGIIDFCAKRGIISDPDFAKENSSASIGSSNPKRLDVKLVAKLGGNSNTISIDFWSGFYYGA